MKFFGEEYKKWEKAEYAREYKERKEDFQTCSVDPMYLRGPGVPTPKNMVPMKPSWFTGEFEAGKFNPKDCEPFFK